MARAPKSHAPGESIGGIPIDPAQRLQLPPAAHGKRPHIKRGSLEAFRAEFGLGKRKAKK